MDIVLGMQWLKGLGKVTADYNTMSMEFWSGETTHIITADNTPSIQPVTVNALLEDWRCGAELFAVTVADGVVSSTDTDQQLPGEVQNILNQFSQVLEEPRTLPPRPRFDHRICLKDETMAVNVSPYRYAHFQKAEIERQVEDMLRVGFIRPSTSPFSSPVLLVKKKDGSWRFCTDYRALNNATIKDRFPIPTIDDMLDELNGAHYFSKLDLRAGYHQVRVHPDDASKTAFRTHSGHYEYFVMPFGLCNAPSTFQAAMNEIFRPHLRVFILIFFDDILIYSRTKDQHLNHLQCTLSILAHHHFYIKPEKCFFLQIKVEYLDHYISREGVQVDPRKIESMVRWPVPTNVTALRGFLGLMGYYRKFVQGYGLIAQPLTRLLKKGKFTWDSESTQAFEALKRAMTSTPVLALPDFTSEFVIETDASGMGVGAVLSQKGHPIAFMSKALGPENQVWSTYAKEMFAILEAIRTWRTYLLGQHFTIYTDQKSLRHLLEQQITTPEQQKWIAKLLGYDYSIILKPGTTNKAADALSRRDNMMTEEPAEAAAISGPLWAIWDELRKQTKIDPYLEKICRELQSQPSSQYEYTIRNGCVVHRGRVMVPENGGLRMQLIKEFHGTSEGGHSGMLRTFRRLNQVFSWAGMRTVVNKYVRECEICQRTKTDSLAPAGLLTPLPVPSVVWADISMDFIEGLPKSQGRDVVLVVVDRFTKYAHSMSLSHPFNAKDVAGVFIREVVRLHGFPETIISDRDRIFMSLFWKELFRLQGTTLKTSSAYHPETDGQTEVVNRCLGKYLRCFVHNYPNRWNLFLTWAELWYNTSYHRSINMTPFEALYGRPPPILRSYKDGRSPLAEVDEQMRTREEVLQSLRHNLVVAANRMKQLADAKRREVHYQIGDHVYLKLQPFRQQSVFKWVSQKLACKFFGPFKILEKLGDVAYRFELPPESRIHPVFHVSLLKKHIGDAIPSTTTLPPYSGDGQPVFEPEKVISFRNIRTRSGVVREALIQWVSLGSEDATWERVEVIKQQFPDFNLEDKVRLQEEGNDEDTGPMGRHSKRARRNSTRLQDYVT
ncbi:unnamed protein product [Cuscuta europaea]|uniref:Reverse transcriptase n=1 Tax=Cuscuta europaea TaxID=41803 RepID=A0A9P0Z470_CUSEU|nr:unnamed protein product [Cuscuta europaea]